MWSKFKQTITYQKEKLIVSLCIALCVTLISYTGVFQFLELSVLDQFFRWRSPEPKDPRIVIITIDEQDIEYLQEWPLSDQNLAKLLTKITQQNPRVIGVDIFRNLPVGQGKENLDQVFSTTPNLIGIKKIVKPTIDSNPILEKLGQVAFDDLVYDSDGKIRRNLLTVQSEDNQEIIFSLGLTMALMYLAQSNIFPQSLDQNGHTLALGKARLTPLRKRSGGYTKFDNGGYQILSNYRGNLDNWETISVKNVLENTVPENLFTDRIVLIGVIAVSIHDRFSTPDINLTPGIIIHANFTSEILSAALDNRPLFRTFSEPVEWIWMMFWTSLANILIWKLIESELVVKGNKYQIFSLFFTSILGLNAFLIYSSYLLFLDYYWLIIATPIISLNLVVIISLFYANYTWQQLAIKDSLTQVANRRYFDLKLHKQWYFKNKKNKYLSLIICDIDCFKKYNDTYGHQQGDTCLKTVAQTMQKSVRNSDLVARYGGEEFVIILPNTESELALKIAQRLVHKIHFLKIPNVNSTASKYVTISCGVASVIINPSLSPYDLINMADKALYQAKTAGRNRALLYF